MSSPLFISITDASAHIPRGCVTLTPLQVEIVFALAYQRCAGRSSALIESLWPECDPLEGENRLYVAVYRLRRRLEDRTSIERTAWGYRLGQHVVCDLPEIEASIRRLTRSLPGQSSCVVELETLAERLRAALGSQEWALHPLLEELERRISDALHAVEAAIGRVALASGDFERALNFARAAIERDACDESALEIAMRAHLALRDRAAALGAYRRYAVTLERELQLQPSTGLRELLA